MSPTRQDQDQLPLAFRPVTELVSSATVANARSTSVQFRFVDLFAGVGGFHHALASMGGQCALSVELDPECRRVYAESFPELKLQRIKSDIRALTRVAADPASEELDPSEIRRRVPPHDVLCAGFPCQPFSKSGHQLGIRDKTRGTLFHDIMSIVIARQPKYVILENVRNLIGPRHEDTWVTIRDSLREAGYLVADRPVIFSPHLLPSQLGGAPQIRDRVFVLARRPSRGRVNDATTVAREPVRGWSPERWSIGSVLDDEVDVARYGLDPVEIGWLDAWQDFVQGLEQRDLPSFPIWVEAFVERPRTAGLPEWKAEFVRKNSAFYLKNKPFIDVWLKARWGPNGDQVADFPASRQKFEWQARRYQRAAEDRDLEGLIVQFRPSGIRVKAPTYAPALVAITQTTVLGPKVTGTAWRRLTPREAARLQGIPYEGFERSGMSDKTVYRQLGNAVNVGVVQHLTRALFDSGGLAYVNPTPCIHLGDAGVQAAEF